MITGFDLVEWQLRVAAGEKLPVVQDAIHVRGHAIEVRLYAEDPERDFAPSIGRLALFRTPESAADIRVDTGFMTGDTVSVHYDAMLAKLISHGASRGDAVRAMGRALAETDVIGVASNLDLLGRIIVHPAFAAGGVDTGFIARHAATLLAPPRDPPLEVRAAAALGVLCREADAARREALAGGDPHSPWNAQDHWWLNAVPERVLPFVHGDTPMPVAVRREGATWRLTIDDRRIEASVTPVAEGRLDVTLNGLRERITVLPLGETVTVRRQGETWRLRLPDPMAAAADEDAAGGRLLAPLPGQVTQVLATPGMAVKRGDVLVVLEAMKTVFRLAAPSDGVVATVACQAGDSVVEGQLLVDFAQPPAA
jgi:3-methylcrotonyl-CoA carboxylase alpha subunit